MKNDEHWKITDHGDSVLYEYTGPPWNPSPEELDRIRKAVAEYWRTHRQVAILCRALPPDPDRPDQIRLVPTTPGDK